jgi:hypothetical protein
MKGILIRFLSNLRKSAKSADNLFLFFVFSAVCSAVADEPFFKKNDVIALVGGEDMVAMSEYGYLELLLQRALPDYHLKFRDLAWEGDTVFEQRRDLNFPPLEAQLDQIGATVVICQFGQMESFAGKEKLPEFVAAYEKLIERLAGGGKRRLRTMAPSPLGEARADVWKDALSAYRLAIDELSIRLGVGRPLYVQDTPFSFAPQRDGLHYPEAALPYVVYLIAARWGLWEGPDMDLTAKEYAPLRQAIRAKNRLWFNYWRVENWAFLAGDRTEQPSSRDWRDPSKRWFPAEREQFLPLIEKKEQEIWALAAKLAQP